MAEELESQWFEAEVIGKTTEQRGWLFKRTAYIIALRISGANSPTVAFEASFDQYCSAEVGKGLQIKLYRTITGSWAAPKEYAEYLNSLAKTS